MAISGREYSIMLSVQATDAGASANINQVAAATSKLTSTFQSSAFKYLAVGEILTKVGQAAVTAGQKLLSFAKSAGMAAMDFDHEMALMQTQAQLSQSQFAKVGDAALKVSSKYGVAATEIATGLYDIFSTTNDTAKQAVDAIDTLAKASIAGATDMSTVTRGVIDIQNAFGKSAGTTTDILNLQFQMLRNSGGTYDELVTGFGNVISAASQMDQKIQTAAGSIAFLTLRGRTQAQASISVSRALDQVSKSAGDIKKTLGVSVYDASGKFRQLNDIVTDMGKKMAGMTSKERASAFYDMFGAGSIQANRFFRLAVPQADKLNKSIDEMSKKEIAGQLRKAFQEIKKNDPSFVFNKLMTSIKNVGIRIANTLAPAFESAIRYIQHIVNWFSKLDDSTKAWIGKAVLIAGVVLVVVGKFLTLAGALSKLMFFAQLAGEAVGGLAGIFGSASLAILAVVAVVAVLAGAAYLIYKNWDTVGPFFKKLWEGIKDAAAAVGDWFMANVVPIFRKVAAFLTQTWDGIVRWWNENSKGIIQAAGKVVSWFVGVFQAFWRNWGDEIVTVAKGAWDLVKGIIGGAIKIIEGIIEVVTNIINGKWEAVWDGVVKILSGAWQIITAILKFAVTYAWTIIKAGFELILIFFENIPHWIMFALGKLPQLLWDLLQTAGDWMWRGIKAGAVALWDWLAEVGDKMLGFLARIPGMLLRLGSHAFHMLWEGIKTTASAIWGWLKGVPGKILGFLSRLPGMLLRLGMQAIRWLWNGIKAIASAVFDWFKELPGKVIGFLQRLPGMMLRAGIQILRGLWNGIKSIAETVWNFFSSIHAKIAAFFANAIGWLVDAGKAVLTGLWNGMKSVLGSITSWLGSLPAKFIASKGPPAKDAVMLYDVGRLIIKGLHKGMRDEIPNVFQTLADMTAKISSTKARMNVDAHIQAAQDAGGSGGSAGDVRALVKALRQSGVLNIAKQETTNKETKGIVASMLAQMKESGHLDLSMIRSVLRDATTPRETHDTLRMLRNEYRKERGLDPLPVGGSHHTRRDPPNVTIHVKDGARGKEIARELNWMYRTNTW